MDGLSHNSSPPLSAKKSTLHGPRPSPPPYSTAYDGDDDRPTLDEKPSARRSDRHNDLDVPDKTSKKPRHRHSSAQLAALNELFDRNEHPSLEERTELAEKLGMETKTVNAWFQNKRASTKKRNKTAPAERATSATHDPVAEKSSKQPLSSNLPSIANLLNSTPPVPAPQLPQHSSRLRSHASSARRPRQKDLHLNDHILADPLAHVTRSQNNRQEAAFESSFFAGPSEFLGQDRFILSHHRGHHPESGAVHRLHNPELEHVLPDTDSRFVSENDGVPSRRGRNEVARMRTSPEQAEELRRAYSFNDHPTREQRQELADKVGMRLQSVTNWFQNQRSQAKKHKEEPASTPDVSAHPVKRQPPSGGDGLATSHMPHPPLPPRLHHPSLMAHEHESRPALLKLSSAGLDDHRGVSTPRSRMSLPPSFNSRMSSPRIRRSAIPYARDSRDLHADEGRHYDNSSEGTRAEDGLSRPRRSRPEPYQLDALKKLLHRTLTPSIEERSALALEIGMDVGKVTNWFRNIRQNARKRGSRPGVSASNPHEHDVSSGSSVYDDDDAMDLVYEDIMDQEMDERSEEEYQEAVTPFTDISSSPPPNKRLRSHLPVHDGKDPMDVGILEPSTFQELRKVAGVSPVGGPSDYELEMNGVTCSGVKIEDALLLLSFHQHVVH